MAKKVKKAAVKKKPVKTAKAVKKPKASAIKGPARKAVGKITHFYPNISVAVVELSGTLKTGDKISIEGHGSSFEQEVESMQIEHEQVETAKKGEAIGMKVEQPVKENAIVYLVK